MKTRESLSNFQNKVINSWQLWWRKDFFYTTLTHLNKNMSILQFTPFTGCFRKSIWFCNLITWLNLAQMIKNFNSKWKSNPEFYVFHFFFCGIEITFTKINFKKCILCGSVQNFERFLHLRLKFEIIWTKTDQVKRRYRFS